MASEREHLHSLGVDCGSLSLVFAHKCSHLLHLQVRRRLARQHFLPQIDDPLLVLGDERRPELAQPAGQGIERALCLLCLRRHLLS